MADMRNRTPFYGAVPTSKLQADHVFMADGSTLQDNFPIKAEDVVYSNTDSRIASTNVQAAIDNTIIYSLTETVIGKWIDGKPIYRKVIPFTEVTTSNTTIGTTSDLEHLVHLTGSAYSVQYDQFYNIPNVHSSIYDYYINCLIYQDNVLLRMGPSITSIDGFVIVEYTKSTDTANRSLQKKIDKLIETNKEQLKDVVIEQEG